MLLIALGYIGCGGSSDSHPKVKIEGGNPPKFLISGRGPLDSIKVGGPDRRRTAPEGAAPYSETYWMIMPKSGMDVMHLQEMGAITYGQIPEGFVQWVPESGEPPPIFEGGVFYFQLHTKDGSGAASSLFTLREGKIISEGYE